MEGESGGIGRGDDLATGIKNVHNNGVCAAVDVVQRKPSTTVRVAAFPIKLKLVAVSFG